MFKIFVKVEGGKEETLDPRNVDGYDLIQEETINKKTETIYYFPGM